MIFFPIIQCDVSPSYATEHTNQKLFSQRDNFPRVVFGVLSEVPRQQEANWFPCGQGRMILIYLRMSSRLRLVWQCVVGCLSPCPEISRRICSSLFTRVGAAVPLTMPDGHRSAADDLSLKRRAFIGPVKSDSHSLITYIPTSSTVGFVPHCTKYQSKLHTISIVCTYGGKVGTVHYIRFRVTAAHSCDAVRGTDCRSTALVAGSTSK